MKVLKFDLLASDKQVVMMPVGADILSVQEWRGEPCIWARCDEKETKKEQRVIFMYGTGNEIDPRAGRYLGTVLLSGGRLVLHLFEEKKEMPMDEIVEKTKQSCYTGGESGNKL